MRGSAYTDLRIIIIIFFFKQKKAYEFDVCDWSSDGCSSDVKVPKKKEKKQTRRMGKREKKEKTPPPKKTEWREREKRGEASRGMSE